MRISLTLCFLFASFSKLAGQEIVTAGFSFPDSPYTICLQEPLLVENTSQSAIEYLWDFCPETFSETPVISEPTTVSGLVNGWGYKVVKNGEKWTGFVLSRSTNKLFRLEFGDDPSNTPIVSDLGNPGDLLVSPQGIDIVNHDGNWFGFIGKGETTTGQIVRLDFGSDLNNLPTAVGLGTFGTSGRRLRDIRVVKQRGDWVLITVLDSDNALLRVNYGNSLQNTISPENVSSTGALPGASLPLGFSVVQHGGEWIVHTVSFSNNGVQQYNFGNDLFNTPTFQGNFTFGSVTRPYYIKVIREADTFYGFIANENKNLSIVKFGDFTSAPQEMDNAALPKYIGFDLAKSGSKNIVQGTMTGTAFFKQVTFENTTCAVAITSSSDRTPSVVSFEKPGTYKIELAAAGANSLSDVSSGSVNVSSFALPAVEILAENICLNSSTSFSVNSTAELKSWNWDFGDDTNSNEAVPTHQYAEAGNYTVRMHVVDINNCSIRKDYLLSVYPKPTSTFTLPSDLLCTNNEFTFTATTPDIYNGYLAYQWFVDNTLVSNGRDLNHTFTTTGSKTIKLITSIPGCSDESSQTTSPVHAGPVVDFLHVGTCEDKPFTFVSQLSEPVESLSWNFGEGYTVNTSEATFTFSSFGDHNVSLTATNAIGCVNTTTRSITVNSRPLVDFQTEGPPNACTGTPTRLDNLTVSPDNSAIKEWQWVFADPVHPQTSPVRDPEYTWSSPGTHRVALTAFSETGCHGMVEKDILINPSPSTTFAQTPACLNVPVVFTGPTGSDIATWYWEIGSSFYTRRELTHTFRSPGNHELLLSVTGTNGCIAIHESTVNVPVPLQPDFSVSKNCAGEDALLTDITTGEDPVVARVWTLEGGEMSDASAINYTFNNIGHTTVALKVTTAAGCSYSQTKEVEIVPPPLASFFASPSSGAYPLHVAFQNTSVGATAYSWLFNDGSGFTTNETDPTFTFEEEGTFDVVLTALNEQHCSSTFVEHISTVAPVPDVNIELISLASNPDGSTKLIITVHNRGNTILKDLPIDLDFSGALSLRQTLDAAVAPGGKYNYIVIPGILNLDVLEYVCVSLQLEHDVSPAGNRACKEFSGGVHTFPVYPNPVASALNVEWVDAGAGVVRVSLIDPAGRQVVVHEAESRPGLNRISLTTSGLRNGLYLLATERQGVRHVQRVAIVDGP